MPQLVYDIGYYGKVSIGGQYLLATGGNVSVQYSPIFTSGVWGANWTYATQKIAYAPNYVTLSGSVNYQLTSSTAVQIASFAFSARNTAKQVCIYPNGVAGYKGDMWCTGCGFSTSQDSLVTGDISLKSGNTTGTITTTSATSTQNQTNAIVGTIATGYRSVYPYWGTGVFLDSQGSTSERITPTQASTQINDILDWNASYSSELVFASCCNYTTAMLQADYCVLGTMNAQGSFTMFKVGKYLTPSQIQNHNKATIKMKDANGQNQHKIKYGAIVWTGASTDIQTGSSLIQSSFNFEALGNTTKAPMDYV